MAKLVRVENADTSGSRVLVQIWEMRGEGKGDALIATHVLISPAEGKEIVLVPSRYIVLKEIA